MQNQVQSNKIYNNIDKSENSTLAHKVDLFELLGGYIVAVDAVFICFLCPFII